MNQTGAARSARTEEGGRRVADFRYDLNMCDRFFSVPRAALPLCGKADALALRALLLLLSGEARSEADLCGLLACTPDVAQHAVQFWLDGGVFALSGGCIAPAGALKAQKPAERRVRELRAPDYSMEEIACAKRENRELADLLQSAQTILGKTLGPADTKRLYSFCEFYGVEPAAVVDLLVYCREIGKVSLRYIEKIIIEWDETGVRTEEQAAAYLDRLMQSHRMENRVRTMFGIGGRALTSAEQAHIRRWITEFQMPEELIRRAYEITVDTKGTLSFAYINAILKNWAEKGVKTVEEADALQKPASARKRESGGAGAHETSLDLDAYSKWMWQAGENGGEK